MRRDIKKGDPSAEEIAAWKAVKDKLQAAPQGSRVGLSEQELIALNSPFTSAPVFEGYIFGRYFYFADTEQSQDPSRGD